MKRIGLFLLFVFMTHYAFANVMCEDATNYHAIYRIKSYTCNAGYYLPANTDGCVACPAGFTCAGGTYTFNPNEYQGAVLNTVLTNTMNNVCATNFPAELHAIYRPKTVTLNFDNGNGTNTSTTCTYDGLINLPPEPTRPGYRFKGWKLIKNE